MPNIAKSCLINTSDWRKQFLSVLSSQKMSEMQHWNY